MKRKKSSYLTRRITNLPVLESVKEFRSKLAHILPDLADKLMKKCQIGFILTRNKKISIISSNDLEVAYGYFTIGNHLWIDPGSSKDLQDQTKEDQCSSTTAKKAGSKSRYTDRNILSKIHVWLVFSA